jgi:hypothetical protein
MFLMAAELVGKSMNACAAVLVGLFVKQGMNETAIAIKAHGKSVEALGTSVRNGIMTLAAAYVLVALIVAFAPSSRKIVDKKIGGVLASQNNPSDPAVFVPQVHASE